MSVKIRRDSVCEEEGMRLRLDGRTALVIIVVRTGAKISSEVRS